MAQRVLSAEERWRAHVRQVRQTKRDDPNEGLSKRQLAVLLESADSERRVVSTLPTGHWAYPAQRTDDHQAALELQALGLIHIMQEAPTLFAYTPIGIALAQELLKRRGTK